MKLLREENKAFFQKDAVSIWSDPPIRTALVAMPLVFVIAVPVIFLAMIYIVPMGSLNGVSRMFELMPGYAQECTVDQMMFYLMVNIVCPMFFLLNALLTASLSSALLFGGEKGRSTSETLMLTPLSAREIFRVKVQCCLLFAGISSVVSIVALLIVVTVGSILLGMFFFSSLWLIVLLVLMPAVSVLGALSMAFLSKRAENTFSCAQLSGYAALPVILLFVLQLTGIYQLNAVVLLVFGVLVIVADIILWGACCRYFSEERLVW